MEKVFLISFFVVIISSCSSLNKTTETHNNSLSNDLVKTSETSSNQSERFPASDINSIKNWFSSILGEHNLKGKNGDNCKGIRINDSGEIIALFPARSNRSNDEMVQLTYFDNSKKMTLKNNTYTALFTQGMEAAKDKHVSISIVKNDDESILSLNVLVWTGLLDKKILIKHECKK